MRLMIRYAAEPTIAESGMVNIHAVMMFPASPHRTAERRVVAPTPIIAPVIVCVVLTAIPLNAVIRSVRPPAVSAQKPPVGFNLVIFCPIVLTILHPPNIVPIAIAKCDMRITHTGTLNSPGFMCSNPDVIRSVVITPIVF